MTVVPAATTSSTVVSAATTSSTEVTSVSVATETNAAPEPSTTVKETNEVVVHPNKENQQRVGCKQGEFLPNTYCNKVSYINHVI